MSAAWGGGVMVGVRGRRGWGGELSLTEEKKKSICQV